MASSGVELARAYRSTAALQRQAGNARGARRAYERAENALRQFDKPIAAAPVSSAEDSFLKDVLRTQAGGELKAVLTELVEFLRQTGRTGDADRAQARLRELEDRRQQR